MRDDINGTDELSVLEPLMSGEYTSYEDTATYREHLDTEDKISEIMAHAHIKRGRSELRESLMQTDTIISFAVLGVIFVLSMEFLPSIPAIPAIMSFLVIKVLLVMKRDGYDLKGALRENIALALLTGLFLFLAILNISDR
ncbi:hypothetical protein [Ruminococcus sp.]|uniref:hypothetical protein n=1 Tax=Ruminococcus sp. TaxID=41978 RepID=UPI0025E704EC|nr:hypothetical protein [Ruminococcus sp.]MBQ8967983.1 hypothetical protein [Ruminococcus sp.]